MFEGFDTARITTEGATIHLRHGGTGPALLLLHGFPQTHVHWHRLAPLLAGSFTLVIPDLPGYGASVGPRPDPTHSAYAKRAMADQMVAVMAALGHERFLLAGHDRGARVAYRLALDHPARVVRLVSLDTTPTVDVWEALDWQAGIEAFHWPLLAQPAPVPETLLAGDPDAFVHHLLDRWAGRPGALDPDAVTAYVAAFRRPEVRAAMCEDYRAGATVDMAHDQADRASGRRLACPLLALRGARYTPRPLRPVWQRWADDVREVELDCGHFIAEEAPQETATSLRAFLAT